MKTGFRQVSINTNSEAEEAVGLLLQRVFGQPYSVFSQPTNITSKVSVFLSEAQSVSQRQRVEVAEGIKNLCECGLNTGLGEVEMKRLKAEDWANSWKRNFKPINIKGKLMVRPSWEKAQLKSGQKTVIIDPGLSFGTGQHETTKYCLEQIVSLRRSDRQQSIVDVGSGSGILSIAAVKMGYRPVLGLDQDPEAVRVAKINAKRNRVDKNLVLEIGDVVDLGIKSRRKYDVVCANLIFGLLRDHAVRVISQLKTDGILILAGILWEQFKDLQKVYEKEGLKLKHTGRRAEWQSGCFIFDS